MGSPVEIVHVDRDDESVLRACWEVEQAAHRAFRPHAMLRPWAGLQSVSVPGEFVRHDLISATSDGTIVGFVDVVFFLKDNLHLAELEINVVPERQREGIGSQLLEAAADHARELGRRTLLGEAYTTDRNVAARRFAEHHDFTPVHEEDHLWVDLPLAADRLAALRSGLDERDDHEIVTWGNHCPDEWVHAYAAMLTQMAADAPSGDVEVTAPVVDATRVRASEERTSAAYDRLVSAARRTADGVFGGYSLMFLPKGDDVAMQDDTLVMPEHRGARLGSRLKLANLDALAASRVDLRGIHTWTDPENSAMYRTNALFGFRSVERMDAMQRRG